MKTILQKCSSMFLLLAMLLMCSCSQTSQESDNIQQSGQISLFAYTPDTLNPLATAYKTNASLLSSTVYASLVSINPDLSISPSVAESWSFSADGYQLTLNIRPDVFFSDGTQLTPSHVLSSFECLKNHESNMFFAATDYIQSGAVSGNTLVLRLKKPGSEVLNHLIFPIIKNADSLLGCGPYVVQSVSKNGLQLVARNDEKAFIRPSIKEISVKYCAKPEMQTSGFLSAEIDVISADMKTLSKLSTKADVQNISYTSDVFFYLGINCESETMQNEDCRKAVAYLIDKKAMTQELFAGYGQVTSSPFRPGSVYANLHNGDFNYNPALSKQYLQKSNVGTLQPLTILVNEENDKKLQIAQFIAKSLQDNGISVTVSTLPFEDYQKVIKEKNYTMYVGEVLLPPDQNLSFLLQSNINHLGFSSTYMDSLLQGFSSAVTLQDKKLYAAEIQKLLLDKAPIISLFYKTDVLMLHSKIGGDFSPMPNKIYNRLDSWSVKE